MFTYDYILANGMRLIKKLGSCYLFVIVLLLIVASRLVVCSEGFYDIGGTNMC